MPNGNHPHPPASLPNQGGPLQVQVKAQDKDLHGRYSNIMQVTHTKEEFILDYMFVVPPQGLLVSRIIASPEHLKRMAKALQENIQRYEEKFGKIEEGEVPQQEIGFQR